MVIFRLLKWVFGFLAKRVLPGLNTKGAASMVAGLLGENGEQLPALLEKLKAGGLGDMVQSWVGTGKNKSLSANQVQSALGADTLSGLAEQMGVSESKAASKVAGALPQLINQLTPEGEVPDQKAIAAKLAELLKR